MPKIKDGLNILIAAHGNSLRALIMELDSIPSNEIVKLEIPTGAPIHYKFNENDEVLSRINLYE
ncbi:2,3-bisphosphoglycerate-dependent phosphoglycerate mutase [compost metagenome]